MKNTLHAILLFKKHAAEMLPTISYTLLQFCPKTAQHPTIHLLRDRHGFLPYTLLQFLNGSRLNP